MLKLAVIAAIFIITIECKYLLAETDSDEDSSQLQKDQVSLSSQLINVECRAIAQHLKLVYQSYSSQPINKNIELNLTLYQNLKHYHVSIYYLLSFPLYFWWKE